MTTCPASGASAPASSLSSASEGVPVPAAHEVAVDVTGTTADVRRLLDYVDLHAPADATVTAADGRLVARWSTEPTQAPTRNTTTREGWGPDATRSQPIGFSLPVTA